VWGSRRLNLAAMAARRSSVRSVRPCRNQGWVLDPSVPARTLYCATTKEGGDGDDGDDGDDRPQQTVLPVMATRVLMDEKKTKERSIRGDATDGSISLSASEAPRRGITLPL